MTFSYMADSDDPLIGAAGFVFQTPVRAKRSKQPSQTKPNTLRRRLKRQIAAVASKSPEAVVKISGSARGRKHLGKHLSYITRNGKLMAETGDGELVIGKDSVAEIAAEWWAMRGDNTRPSAGARSRDTYNFVLSMPVGTDPEKLHGAAREFARKEFSGKHDYIMVLHTAETDPNKKTKQPHVHLTVRTLGLQGQYLNPKKADLQAWRECFCEALRRHGVQAESTPRRARGVVAKGVRQAERHMGKRSRNNQWRVDQAIKSIRGADDKRDEPWRNHIQQRQEKIRAAWRTIASALDAQGEIVLAGQVRAHVDGMPPVRTRQDLLNQRAEQASRSGEQAKLLDQTQSVLKKAEPTQERDKRRR